MAIGLPTLNYSMELKLTEKLPDGLKPFAIERAVKAFVKDSRASKLRIDLDGYQQQIFSTIAHALVWGRQAGDFWLAENDGEVTAFAICQAMVSIDNKLTYWMNDAWVSPKYRHTPFVRECFEKLRAEAKQLGCKHIIVPSSRGTKGYLKFLGKQWHSYVSLLKEDI